MKNLINKVPVLRSLFKAIYFRVIAPFHSFSSSEDYWQKRYKSGGLSGTGSYDELAAFKAEVLTRFIEDENVHSVIEFGCGDGNQLTLINLPGYLGFDISPDALDRCKKLFTDDDSKAFKLISDFANENAELTLSLDVIYHLVEDQVFDQYMHRLFMSAQRFVIIYSSNTDQQVKYQAAHVRHRNFSSWIETHKPEWILIQHIPNKYPTIGVEPGAPAADFFIYEKSKA